MGKLLIFNFDGTGNEPSDAQQEMHHGGAREDDNITNVLKFHLMCGGNLYREGPLYGASALSDTQGCFYYPGIGTYGSRINRLLNNLFAPGKSDVAGILHTAMRDFERHYLDGDTLLITGFSRGAALARRFAWLVSNRAGGSVQNAAGFIYLACWDTVASIGLPNFSKADRPDFDVVFEFGQTLASGVARAVHMVSLDDKRKAFQPTLMNYDAERVNEIWFAGAHSDVGGGFYRDGLSDIALQYFFDWLGEQALELQWCQPGSEALDAAIPPQARYAIGVDDMAIVPDSLGKNHQQDRWPVVDWFTLTDRELCVIDNDRISQEHKPVIHWSVAERVFGDRDYRPRSLKDKPHLIEYEDNARFDGVGFNHYCDFARVNWRFLRSAGQSLEVQVFAASRSNHTGLMLERGVTYRITPLDGQYWRDGDITCDASGWDRDDVKLGLKEIPIALFESQRRVPHADWFTLCGMIGEREETAFEIGKQGCDYTPAISGELCAFANDLTYRYANNRGKIRVKVTRMT